MAGHSGSQASLTALAIVAMVGAASLAVACDKPAAEKDRDPTATPSASATLEGPLAPARGVRLVTAPSGDDVAAIVRATKADNPGRAVLVYTGATWCEPCRRFHHAAEAGQLDDAFPSLTLLVFDLDADRDRLAKAGYSSKFIPLFVLPRADGTASELNVQGSVEGDGAVAQITPRLRVLIAEAH